MDKAGLVSIAPRDTQIPPSPARLKKKAETAQLSNVLKLHKLHFPPRQYKVLCYSTDFAPDAVLALSCKSHFHSGTC